MFQLPFVRISLHRTIYFLNLINVSNQKDTRIIREKIKRENKPGVLVNHKLLCIFGGIINLNIYKYDYRCPKRNKE